MYVQYMCVLGSLRPVCRPLLLLTTCVCAGGLLGVHLCVCGEVNTSLRVVCVFWCSSCVDLKGHCAPEQAWGGSSPIF